MHFEGELRVRAPYERVRLFFLDPRRVAENVKDPHSIEVMDVHHFRGEITTGISFIRGTFHITGEYVPPEPSRDLRVRLHGSGLGSELDATLSASLLDGGDGTTVRWSVDITLGGAAGALGEWLVRKTVVAKITEFLDTVRRKLESVSPATN